MLFGKIIVSSLGMVISPAKSDSQNTNFSIITTITHQHVIHFHIGLLLVYNAPTQGEYQHL